VVFSHEFEVLPCQSFDLVKPARNMARLQVPFKAGECPKQGLLGALQPLAVSSSRLINEQLPQDVRLSF
ncbi:MAG: hypothetical protein AAFZ01_10350, partial [Pseudomonadota bacterium]